MSTECNKCGGDMYEDIFLVGRTTHANIDDEFETKMVCEECGYVEEFEVSEDMYMDDFDT